MVRPAWDEYPCIPGTGAKHSQGYRQIYVDGKQVLEHRVVFEEFYGYLPEEPAVSLAGGYPSGQYATGYHSR